MSTAPATKTRPVGTLMISIGVHAAVIGLAVLVIVSRYMVKEEEPAFVAQPRVQLPAEIR